MKVTFLGTGTSQGIPIIGCDCDICTSPNPKDKRLRVSVLIEIEQKSFVIDVGPDFRQQMLRAKVQKIDAVLITHEHRDHIAGLDDVRPFNFRYHMDMPVYTYPRVQESLKLAYDYIFKATYPGVPRIELKTIEKNVDFEVEGIRIQPIEYWHGKLPIMGFRIKDFAYLTDFKSIEEDQFKKLENLDVLVLSALHHMEHHSHLTLEQAIDMAQKINAKQTYFTHMSHFMGLHDDINADLPDNIQLAYDGLILEM